MCSRRCPLWRCRCPHPHYPRPRSTHGCPTFIEETLLSGGLVSCFKRVSQCLDGLSSTRDEPVHTKKHALAPLGSHMRASERQGAPLPWADMRAEPDGAHTDTERRSKALFRPLNHSYGWASQALHSRSTHDEGRARAGSHTAEDGIQACSGAAETDIRAMAMYLASEARDGWRGDSA